VRPQWLGRCEPKPANEVITDSGAEKPAIPLIADPPNPNPNQKPSFEGRAKQLQTGQRERGDHDSAVVPAQRLRAVPEAIDVGLSRGRNAMAIWQTWFRYGFASSYQSVQRFVRSGAERKRRSRVVIVTAAAGGASRLRHRPMVRDPRTASIGAPLFVMTLAAAASRFVC